MERNGEIDIMSDILIIYLCLPLGFLAGAVFVIVEHVSGNINLDNMFGKWVNLNLFNKPVVLADEEPPIGTINFDDIQLDVPYKHYAIFIYKKGSMEFRFTIAELEMLHKRALELMKEWRNDG